MQTVTLGVCFRQNFGEITDDEALIDNNEWSKLNTEAATSA